MQHGEEDPVPGSLTLVKGIHLPNGNAIQFEDDISDVKAYVGGGAINSLHLTGDPRVLKAVVGLGPDVS